MPGEMLRLQQEGPVLTVVTFAGTLPNGHFLTPLTLIGSTRTFCFFNFVKIFIPKIQKIQKNLRLVEPGS